MTRGTTRAFSLSLSNHGWHRQVPRPTLGQRSPSLGGLQILRGFLKIAWSSLPPASFSGSVWAFATSLLCCQLLRALYKDHRIRLHKFWWVNQPMLVFPPYSLNVWPCPVLLLLPTLFLTPFPHGSYLVPFSGQDFPKPASSPVILSFYLNIQTFPLSQSCSVLGPTW